MDGGVRARMNGSKLASGSRVAIVGGGNAGAGLAASERDRTESLGRRFSFDEVLQRASSLGLEISGGDGASRGQSHRYMQERRATIAEKWSVRAKNWLFSAGTSFPLSLNGLWPNRHARACRRGPRAYQVAPS